MLILRLMLALLFLLVGAVGIFLPILPGWLGFLLAGVLLFPRSRFAVAVLHKAEPKLPRIVHWLRRLGIGEATPL